MKDFVAIDFETAVKHHISAVGIVSFKHGKIVEEYYSLVQPPKNKHNFHNTRVNGISAKDTKDAPFFSAIYPEIKKRLQGKIVVAHNEPFDRNVLAKSMKDLDIDYSELNLPDRWECTYKMYGSALNICCEEHNIDLDHHEALSDARACGELYLKQLE